MTGATRPEAGPAAPSAAAEGGGVRALGRALDRAAVLVLLALIRLYQLTLSPFIGRFCRFQPTCSRYAQEALRVHGSLRGSWLAARRIARCHPLGGWGYDPVPPPSSQPPTS